MKPTFLNSLTVTAALLSVFTIICLVELLIELSAPRDYLIAQGILIGLVGIGTWLCWRHGLRLSGSAAWRYFFLRVLPLAIVLYVAGYFVLMNRHIPVLTGPGGVVDYQSSFRFAPPMSPTSLRMVTIWNFLYAPMDSLSFCLFPRSADEIAELRRKGLIYP